MRASVQRGVGIGAGVALAGGMIAGYEILGDNLYQQQVLRCADALDAEVVEQSEITANCDSKYFQVSDAISSSDGLKAEVSYPKPSEYIEAAMPEAVGKDDVDRRLFFLMSVVIGSGVIYINELNVGRKKEDERIEELQSLGGAFFV